MKKFVIVLLVFLLALPLAACGGNKDIDLAALKADIEGGNLFVDELVSLSQDRIKSVARLDPALCESAEFYMGSGAEGEEYGIFKCNSGEDAKTLVTQIEARRDNQKELYAGYKPEVVPSIENAVIRQAGVYVVYISTAKYAEAAAIADTYFK